MWSRAEPANVDLLARHLAERIRLHEGDPIDVLSGLKSALPKTYHDLLQELEQRARQQGSLALALMAQPHSSLQQLGQFLQQPNAEVPVTLAEWLLQRARTQRIGALIDKAINQQLMYFLTLLVMFSVISLTWLMYVAPTYNELFRELAGSDRAPSLSQWLLTLADSDHPLIWLLKLALLLLPMLAGVLAWLLKHQLKRLQNGQPMLQRLRSWPLFSRFFAVHSLFLSPSNPEQLVPLLTMDEQLELKLAQQGGYLSAQLDSLRGQPEAVLAARVAKPLQRLTLVLTALLWTAIAGFLVAAYQPIFSLGAAL